ncbi:hypothetical protein PNQ29_00010 [Halobacterium salinarum]|uniref:hypothetical protein n=1 Tax=Halobacterium salinarum TaxID=2242 RepID=UPI00255663FA|nr:hypothetical protein [Halobacterium salinarum]MDL0118144.1 hypothetical protein [Halobacterium salinarum]
MADADEENTLRRAVAQDRTEYLEIIDTLAKKTPAEEIRKDGSVEILSLWQIWG